MKKNKISVEDFRRWGSKGGLSTTEKKAQAARENGKKGGRPRLKKKKKEKAE